MTDQFGNCVAYKISFNLHKTLATKFLDFRCGIPNCVLEVIAFECTLNGKYNGLYFNETSNKTEDQNKPKDANDGNGLCRGNEISFAIYKKKKHSID